MTLCPQCNQESPANSRFCVQCGSRLPKDSSTHMGVSRPSVQVQQTDSEALDSSSQEPVDICGLIHNSKQASLKAETLARDAVSAAQLAKQGQVDKLKVSEELAAKSQGMFDIACQVAKKALEHAKASDNTTWITDAEAALASAEDMQNIVQNAAFAAKTARHFVADTSVHEEDTGSRLSKTEAFLPPIESGNFFSIPAIDDEDDEDDEEEDMDSEKKTQIGMLPVPQAFPVEKDAQDSQEPLSLKDSFDKLFSDSELASFSASASPASTASADENGRSLDLDVIMNATDLLVLSDPLGQAGSTNKAKKGYTEDEKARLEAKFKEDIEAKIRAEFEAQLRAEAEARLEAEAAARRVAEEKARLEAEAAARRVAEEQARREAEEKARLEAEEQARREAEEQARREAEEQARREAEEQARREAEEQARREAEEQARREAEEAALRARIEAEMRQKLEAEYRERIEAEARARIAAEAVEARIREEMQHQDTDDFVKTMLSDVSAASDVQAETLEDARAKSAQEPRPTEYFQVVVSPVKRESQSDSLPKEPSALDAVEVASVAEAEEHADQDTRPKKKKKKKNRDKTGSREESLASSKTEQVLPPVAESTIVSLSEDGNVDFLNDGEDDADDLSSQDEDDKFDLESENGFFGGHMSQVVPAVDGHVRREAENAGSGKTKIFIVIFVLLAAVAIALFLLKVI